MFYNYFLPELYSDYNMRAQRFIENAKTDLARYVDARLTHINDHLSENFEKAEENLGCCAEKYCCCSMKHPNPLEWKNFAINQQWILMNYMNRRYKNLIEFASKANACCNNKAQEEYQEKECEEKKQIRRAKAL